MSKVKFNADEMMVMAMFEQPTRTETMRYIMLIFQIADCRTVISVFYCDVF